MRKFVVSLSILALLGGTAIAQTGNNKKMSTGETIKGNIPDAPIGHRQPRASDVPSEKNLSDPNDPLSRENQALDKKIKSICKGC